MGTRRTAKLACLLLVVVVLASQQALYTLALGTAGSGMVSIGYLIVEKAHYYGGADAAFIFRVDDYVVDPAYYHVFPDDFKKPARFFQNYQEQLVAHVTGEYPWLRVTLGVVTSCAGHSCDSGWSTLRYLVDGYGWEAASHTRFHTRPPKSPVDYLGSIDDIESNITGYRVLTYIEPLGKAEDYEIRNLANHGVRIVMDSSPGIPEPVELEENPVRLHFTVKASHNLPWRPLLDAALREALASRGVIVFYTHATSYDWPDSLELLDAVDYAASMLQDRRVWVTTPGELYSYTRIYEESRISYHVENGSLVIDINGSPPSDAWRMPLTIIIYTGEARVDSVEANGVELPRLESSWPLSRPVEGYTVGDGYIAVSVVPPARVVVKLEGSSFLALPNEIINVDWFLAKARLASLILWAPIVGKALLAYKEARRNRRRDQSPTGRDRASYIAVVPARNASETIESVIRSLLGQTVRPTAIVVADDASSDDTPEKVARLAASLGGTLLRAGRRNGYEELVYDVDGVLIHILKSRTHRGKAVNVNTAVKMLSGSLDFDYILMVDSDTILDPQAAERLLARLEGHPDRAAASGLILLWKPDRSGRLAWAIAGAFRNLGGALLSLGLRRVESLSGSLGGSNGAIMMVRTSAFTRLGGLPENTLAEDTVFVWRLQLHGYKAVLAHDAVAYTIDPGSILGLARKTMRISAGLVEGGIRILPRALARGRLMLAATIAYNTLGGLPLALAVAHVATTIVLLAVGAYAATTTFRLATLLPYAPVALALAVLLRDPLAYAITVYLVGLAEAVLAAILLTIPGNSQKARKTVRSSLKYAPVFPIVLWASVIAVMAGIPYALYRIATGKSQARW